MDMRTPPLTIKILLESNPLKIQSPSAEIGRADVPPQPPSSPPGRSSAPEEPFSPTDTAGSRYRSTCLKLMLASFSAVVDQGLGAGGRALITIITMIMMIIVKSSIVMITMILISGTTNSSSSRRRQAEAGRGLGAGGRAPPPGGPSARGSAATGPGPGRRCPGCCLLK